MSTHGPLYDEFGRSPQDPHGAQHDEFGGGGAAQSGKRGPEHDKFGKPDATEAHGAQWDEFGEWQAMPMLYGSQFDEDFASPSALDGEHGTWHDTFRGGTQVRYIENGCDYEGTVLNTGHDHVIVRPRGGGRVELALGQITELKAATRSGQPDRAGTKNATPGHTPAPIRRSPADAPSAHDSTARGGGRVEGIGPGQDRNVLNKSLDESLDELRKIAADS